MLLLDTSFLVEYETEFVTGAIGPARRLLRSRSLEPVAISIITLGEFAEGFENIHDVEAFLSRFRVIPLSRAIAYKAAAMQAHLPHSDWERTMRGLPPRHWLSKQSCPDESMLLCGSRG